MTAPRHLCLAPEDDQFPQALTSRALAVIPQVSSDPLTAAEVHAD